MSQVMLYPKSNANLQHFENWSCAICQGDNPSILGGTVVHKGGEAHPEHMDCLKTWLTRKTECPSCRTPIDPLSTPLNNTWAFAIENPTTFFNYLVQSSPPLIGRNVLMECGASAVPLAIGCLTKGPLTTVLGGILTNVVTGYWEKPFQSESEITNKFVATVQKISKFSTDKAARSHQNYLDSVAFTNGGQEIELLNESIGKLPEEIQSSTREIFRKAMAEDPEPLRNNWLEAKGEAAITMKLKNTLETQATKHSFRYWSVYLLNRASLLILIQQTVNLFLNAKK